MSCFRLVPLFQATLTKQDLGISSGFFPKFPTSTPVLFYMGAPWGGGVRYPIVGFSLSVDKIGNQQRDCKFVGRVGPW